MMRPVNFISISVVYRRRQVILYLSLLESSYRWRNWFGEGKSLLSLFFQNFSTNSIQPNEVTPTWPHATFTILMFKFWAIQKYILWEWPNVGHFSFFFFLLTRLPKSCKLKLRQWLVTIQCVSMRMSHSKYYKYISGPLNIILSRF